MIWWTGTIKNCDQITFLYHFILNDGVGLGTCVGHGFFFGIGDVTILVLFNFNVDDTFLDKYLKLLLRRKSISFFKCIILVEMSCEWQKNKKEK